MKSVVSSGNSFELSTEHSRLQAEAQQVAADFAPRAVDIRQHLIDHSEIHPELWTTFLDHGWTDLRRPGRAGDRGSDLLGTALVLEAFAEQGIVLWMPVLSAAIAHAIEAVGPESARQTWLPRVYAGSTHLAMAATEPSTGHNMFGVETEIRRAGDHFVVNGLKRITSGVDLADRVLVFGRADRTDRSAGYTTVLVDPHASGTTITEVPMRYREGVRQFQLEFDNVAVAADALVGTEGQGLLTMWPFTHVERVLTAAVCTGTAAYSLTRAIARAKDRVISGKSPIGAEQSIAHPLASLHARSAAVRLLVYRTATRIDAGADADTIAGDINIAKLLAADLAFDSADHAMQVLGATAWDEREGLIDIYLDARLSRSGPVSNEFALNHIAHQVLGLPTHRS
ncbi:acyl-CoA dehydrogenase [Nocardia sp. SYP-A9097]|uniref:acyl-CoA dehydrogenase family protein n=1 Tax=Nocardia sp. SYP-A9097 TaxID=2663237 RepID=UPI00129B315C|nr:acyl-CoA dehydrogenase family protein [Nocardia sp. SYP-A9097]MRH87764.1 acyl-CoA dehydrogenase [Nocardia sp. SYP-A9097]